MPVAVLVVVMLGSIAVDRAVVFGAQRELVNATQAAANDAAAVGIDLDRLHADGSLTYDSRRIEQTITAALSSIDQPIQRSWTIVGDQVEVRVQQTVRMVFAAGVPGAARTQRITATASARLVLS